MAKIDITLPDPMMRLIEQQTGADHSGGVEDYLRMLIQRDLDGEQEPAPGEAVETSATEVPERSVEAKAEFLSAMSHELRTPLNAILGFGQLLEANPDEPLTPTQAASVTQIILGGRRLLRLIDEIVDLAKAEAGQVDVQTQTVPVDDVVAECIEELRETAEQREIRITTQILNAPAVRADRTRFKQVLRHLIANAVKFNRHGGTVHISSSSDTSGMLVLRVLDTGNGIPYDRSQDVFDPFVRLVPDSDKPAGSGIGLSLCRNLIGTMGGNMGFESVPDIGSNFWVELPQADAPAPAPRTQSSQAAEALFAGPQGEVFYVEDNPANLDLMKAVCNSRCKTRPL